jgi:hypothetical protein
LTNPKDYDGIAARSVNRRTLLAFHVQLKANKKPTDIVDDMAQILDQEAEIFTVKLWRLLIYESEAARLGLN